ncbi:hypothetical protein LCGC14_1148780 [marine sediment metagenome]|uniref:Uncharacterized protein n=1 Tax=marine sediment metagenome TaxID=412755 RepID=A0A0F9Q1T5_9ZZZZ
MTVMTGRVLPESEVEDLEDLIQAFGKLFPAEAKKLIASHRLLQEQVKGLEAAMSQDSDMERTREAHD